MVGMPPVGSILPPHGTPHALVGRAADLDGEDTMTTTSTQPGVIPGLDQAPTKHQQMVDWVRGVAELTKPDRVVWADGSQQEWDRLTSELVEAGTFIRLDETKRPNSFYAASDPTDVARVEDRTFICSEQ